MREAFKEGLAFEPSTCRAGEDGPFVCRYIVGDAGLSTGDVVRIQLPDSWHAWRRNGAKGIQSTNPSDANYVTARASRDGVSVHCEVEGGSCEPVVKTNRVGLDGRAGRYVYVTRVTLVEGALVPGEFIDIIYGDRAHGGEGFAGPLYVDGLETVRAEVTRASAVSQGTVKHSLTTTVQVVAGAAREVVCVLPSIAEVGRAILARVVLLDAEGNLVPADHQQLQLASVGVECSNRDLELAVRGDHWEALLTPVQVGTLRVSLSAPGVAEAVLSNPCWVREGSLTRQIFWGDLHSHAADSFDATGCTPYEYARDVSLLDFYALTEHCERLAPGAWERLCRRAEAYYEPGRFATFPAYEATFDAPWGHHNVYFRGPTESDPFGSTDGTLIDLWARLSPGEAMTIPHHTGVVFSQLAKGQIPGGVSPAVDWTFHDERFRRTIEIYSGHGQSEFYDPAFDLSYESSDFSTNTSAAGPHYARDAWELGRVLGVIASSDNHHAQPGRSELGLAAVCASELTRDAIFDGLLERRTYATTGSRMLLEVSSGEGSVSGRRRRRCPFHLNISVAGTDVLEVVEVFSGALGCVNSVRRVAEWHPDSLDWEGSFERDGVSVTAGEFYYVRVRQQNVWRGRHPTAWSSPVWVGR